MITVADMDRFHVELKPVMDGLGKNGLTIWLQRNDISEEAFSGFLLVYMKEFKNLVTNKGNDQEAVLISLLTTVASAFTAGWEMHKEFGKEPTRV